MLQAATAEPSLVEIVTTLKDDAGRYAKAEFDVVKAKAGKRVAALKMTVIYGVVAFLVAQGATVALLVGAVWTLAKFLGPALATIIVVVIAFAIALVLVKMAAGSLSKGSKDAR